MNFSDLQKVTELSQEKLSITAAIAMLSTGGKITAMTVSGGDYTGPMPGPMPGMSGMAGMPVSINTQGIEYPAQMVEGIKAALQPRLEELTKELTDLGVTMPEARQ